MISWLFTDSRIKHILPKYIIYTLYYTMIYSYLHYCNIVWASTYPSRLKKLVVLQKIIRIISAYKYRDHTSNYFKELSILKFPDINFLQTALFMYNINRKLLPSHLIKSFIKIMKFIIIAPDHPTTIIWNQ